MASTQPTLSATTISTVTGETVTSSGVLQVSNCMQITNISASNTSSKAEYERIKLAVAEHAKKVLPAKEIVRQCHATNRWSFQFQLPGDMRSFSSKKKTPVKTGGFFTPQVRGKSTRMEKKARNQKRQQRGG